MALGLALPASVAAAPAQPKTNAPRPMVRPELCGDTEPGRGLLGPFLSEARERVRQPVDIDADEARGSAGGPITFLGDVQLLSGGYRVTADELTYRPDASRIDAKGNIELHSEQGDTLRAPVLQYQLNTDSGFADSAQIAFGKNGARAGARRITFLDRDHMELDRMSYTACPFGNDDWFLNGSHLEMDWATEDAYLTNAWIEFKGVPLFYAPYLSFPLTDKRRTGFLNPRYGNSTTVGNFLTVPYYFNLAPNYDDTLTLREMRKRGAQFQNELRYITRGGATGLLYVEDLPQDKVTGTERTSVLFSHNQSLGPGWSGAVLFRSVSDAAYLQDLAESSADAGLVHLPQQATATYFGPISRFSLGLLTYQTANPVIAPDDRPYQRLPRITFGAEQSFGPAAPHLALDSEYSHFRRRPNLDPTLDYWRPSSVDRVDVTPSMSLPLQASYAYLIPKASLRYTSYTIARDQDSTLTRTVPIYSVDTGLLFDRDYRFGERAYVQTLEPRAFFLRSPYRDQSAYPVVDSGVPDFSFYNLFRENRFSGADRQGDANHVAVALSSRVLRANGDELARLSVGQIIYRDDERVTIPPDPKQPANQVGTNTAGVSYRAAELQARIGAHWYTRGSLLWDPSHDNDTQQGSAIIAYQPRPDTTVDAGYRYTKPAATATPPPGLTPELADVGLRLPLGPQWRFQARQNYALRTQERTYTYASLEYLSCCYALRAIWRNRTKGFDEFGQPRGGDRAVYFELELTGLGNLGRHPEQPAPYGRFLFE